MTRTGLTWVALGALAVAAGCGGSPAAPSGRTRLQLTTEVTRTVVPRGGDTTVTFTVENRGSGEVTLTSPSACLILPTITDRATGRVVYPVTPWACAAVITTRRLGPGESEWADVRIRAAEAVPFLYVPLPPGDYDVRASLQTLETELRWGPVRVTVQ